jgi:hypothetical protein
MAHENDNPCEFIFKFLNNLPKPLIVADVMQLIAEIKAAKSPISNVIDDINPMHDTLTDINGFKKSIERERPKNEALISAYSYFATCITHVWLTPSLQLVREYPIIPYVVANKPLPYVWFNVNESIDTKLELVKHTLINDEYNPLRVIVHMVQHPGSLVTCKLSFDLVTGDCMTALHGDFMQIAIRLDQRDAYLQSCCKTIECVVVITYQSVLLGIYYNDTSTKLPHACLYSIH